MRTVRLAHEIDVAGWREAARALRLAAIPPGDVRWRVGAEADLLGEDGPLPSPHPGAAFTAPRDFLELVQDVGLNRAEDRFDLLYRLLWRLKDEPALMRLITDADVARVLRLQKEVAHAVHKMHAFVRFRRLEGEDEAYVAWFEPPHRVVERGVDYFVRRMGRIPFSILSPDVCVHWDGTALSSTPGVEKPAQGEDGLEAHWRTYYAATFNPARLNPKLMAQHMPRAYWRNLPEAAAIPELVAEASRRTAAMVQSTPSPPSARAMKAALRQSRDMPAEGGVAPSSLEEIAASVQVCRRCELWRHATQGVAGEGPRTARLMFVGEQPGDQEDLAGHPFVGPAGQVLDRALAEAGVPRAETFVTNSVKHFKHELRGKRRIHAKPDAGEVKACRWWLDNEIRLVKPKVVVALGATAAQAIYGRAVPVLKARGPGETLKGGAQGFVTIHPSMLLRIPDADAKAAAYKDFVRDLAQAWALVGQA